MDYDVILWYTKQNNRPQSSYSSNDNWLTNHSSIKRIYKIGDEQYRIELKNKKIKTLEVVKKKSRLAISWWIEDLRKYFSRNWSRGQRA